MNPVTHFAINYHVRQNYRLEPARNADARELLAAWAQVNPANVTPQSIVLNHGETDLQVIGRCQGCGNFVLDDEQYAIGTDGTHYLCEQCVILRPDVSDVYESSDFPSAEQDEELWENRAQLWIDG